MTAVGGLVFWDTLEGYLKAADARTDKELWQLQTGGGIVTPPVTWEDNDRRFIAVMSG